MSGQPTVVDAAELTRLREVERLAIEYRRAATHARAVAKRGPVGTAVFLSEDAYNEYERETDEAGEAKYAAEQALFAALEARNG